MSAQLLLGVTPALPQWGVIQADGPDAASFLHGQLTQDFVLMKADQARLAALCSPKGRMLASFLGIKPSADRVLLLCSQDLLAATLKRLSMFVLRAKVKLTDASALWRVHGIAGSAVVAQGLDPTAAPWRCESLHDGYAIHLYPADGASRVLWVAPASSLAPAGELLDLERWAWSEVRSGVATLSAPVVDAFVPQMLNYESIEGVNFKKGCYPGQEVVARSQFRGTLKRRLFLAHTPEALAAGQEVFVASDPEQPVGLVVQAALAPSGAWVALVALQVAAAESDELRVRSAAGAPLTLDPLPYPLRDNI